MNLHGQLMKSDFMDSSDTNLIPHIEIGEQGDSSFKIEPNLGLALPFQHYIDDNKKNETRKSVVTSTDGDGNIFFLEISTQSDSGPLQAMENDVLISLLSMAVDQKNKHQETSGKKRVFYSLAEICRRLGISEGSSGRVKSAIEKIKAQKVSFKNYIYVAETSEYFKGEFNTRIILSDGKVTMGSVNSDTIKEFFYADFEPVIIKNLLNNYYSVIEHKRYLELSPGNQRRILVFLFSKKKTFGNEFIFDLEELARVLGISDSIKKRYIIGDHLNKIIEIYKEIRFEIKKMKGTTSYNILISFDSISEIDHKVDPFWQDLLFDYGESELMKLDIQMHDVLAMRVELNKKFSRLCNLNEFKFRGKLYSPSEFAIDVTLYQVLKGNYKLTKGLKSLANKIIETMANETHELPEKYRLFLTERVREKKKIIAEEQAKEVYRKKIKDELTQEENFEKAFSKLFKETIQNKANVREKLRGEAINELFLEGIDEHTLLFEAEVSQRMFKIAKYYAKEGKWDIFTTKFKNMETPTTDQ